MLGNLLLRNPAATSTKLYVEDFFSTYLYTGNGSSAGVTQTITNGINLSANGGMVWVKGRTNSVGHSIYDTNRGVGTSGSTNANQLFLNSVNAVSPGGNGTQQLDYLTAFTTSGFTVAYSGGTSGNSVLNANNEKYASWSFRKAAKFFDIVTYTGNGANRTISHNLGVAPGMIWVKRLDSSGGAWTVYHRSLTATDFLGIDTAAASTGSTIWNSTAPTATAFSVSNGTTVNASGGSYVAYLFAHDSTSDGIIQNGGFTTNASGVATVTLGWEPQFLLIKATGSTGSWLIYDTMRGIVTGGNDYTLNAQGTATEVSSANNVDLNPTGFTTAGLTASVTYAYMAIRRGPMRIPTDASKVFEITARAGNNTDGTVVGSSVLADFAYVRNRGAYSAVIGDRLRGNPYLQPTNTTSSPAEITDITNGFNANPWDVMAGFKVATGNVTTNNLLNGTNSNSYINYALRRAPNFFDIVCYTGDGLNNRIVNHNLGVIPEFIILRQRDAAGSWYAFNSTAGGSWWLNYIAFSNILNQVNYGGTGLVAAPTSSTFTLGTSSLVNGSGSKFVAYLFASCPGVSKIGSYTGNGTSIDIDCGFTAGARFVLLRRTNVTSSNWTIFDTARGIIAANDPYFFSNGVAAEGTTVDSIDPFTTGFTVVQNTTTNLNVSGSNYIYLAIA